MGNRTARFISTLVASIVAGAPLAAISQNAPSQPAAAASTANAASDCLTSPKSTAPEGQHWYYRVERSTKRQCWYLRAEGGKTATTTQTANAAPQPDSPPPHSVQDARAEYIAPQSGAAQPAAALQAPSTNADSNAQQPAVAARWPDGSMAAAAPAPQPAAAPTTSDARPSAKPAASLAQSPAQSPAPVPLAAAEAPADKPTGSVQMLLLVIGGALALAGLLASIIYRFAGGRGRIPAGDRRVNWDHREPQHHDDSRAPWLDAVPNRVPRAERPPPVDFDAVRPQAPQIAAFSDAIGRAAAQARSTDVAATEADETEIEIFDGEFEIEASAPQLVADDSHDEAPADRDEDARDEDAVDIDIITAMLERLAKEGPRLTQPSPEADLADLAQNRRGQSAARA